MALPRAGTTTPLAPVARHGAEAQVSKGSTGLSQAERRMDPQEAATRRPQKCTYLSFGRSGPAAGAPSRRPTFRLAHRPTRRRPTFRLFGPIKLCRRPVAITAAAPPAISAPVPTEVDPLTAGSHSHRTAQTLVRAPLTAARTTSDTLVDTEEGAPPRSERLEGQSRAPTRRHQRLCRLVSPSPSPENRSSIPGDTASSIYSSPRPG